MPRIPLPTPETMDAAQRRVYDAMLSGPRKSAPVGPLAVAMHRPDLAEAMSALGLVLRFNSSFELRLREFAILTCGRFWDCQFEWASHEIEARKAGLAPTLFGYTDTSPDPEGLSPRDPRLFTYEGVLPGYDVGQTLHEDFKP